MGGTLCEEGIEQTCARLLTGSAALGELVENGEGEVEGQGQAEEVLAPAQTPRLVVDVRAVLLQLRPQRVVQLERICDGLSEAESAGGVAWRTSEDEGEQRDEGEQLGDVPARRDIPVLRVPAYDKWGLLSSVVVKVIRCGRWL